MRRARFIGECTCWFVQRHQLKEYLLSSLSPRSQLGLAFIHLALTSAAPGMRKAVFAALERCTSSKPHLLRDAFTSFLSQDPSASAPSKITATFTTSKDRPDAVAWKKHGRLSALPSSSVSFKEEEGVEEKTRQDAVVGLVILAHHHLVSGYLLFVCVEREHRRLTRSSSP